MSVSLNPLQPKEALAYWREKKVVSAAEFKSLEGAARSRAFAVSGLSRLDQIGAVQAAIGKAVENGETLADFKGRIGGILAEQGWSGKKAWRVENIFRTNVQSAYMAGRFQQMKRVVTNRPFWKYSAVNDRRTRPEHSALHGMVYPHDHPFWSQFYPPNGFMCRCTVTTISARQIKARGLKVQSEMPGTVRVVDPKTGMETFVTPLPDRGWSNNIGEDWLAGLTPSKLEGKLKNLTASALCNQSEFAAHDSCKPSLSNIDRQHVLAINKAKDLLPKTMGKQERVLAFLKEFGLKNLNASKVVTIPGGHPLVVSKWLFTDKHTGKLKSGWADKGPYMKLLAHTIQNPFEVWWTPVEVGPHKRVMFALRLFRLFSLPGSKDIGGYCSFSLLGRQWHGATAFMPKAGRSQEAILEYLEKQRGGVLVYREQLK